MNWLKDLIENQLDDNARVMLFGLGDGAVERVKERISSEYRGLGGSENFTDRDLDEKIKDIQRGIIPQMGVAAGGFAVNLKLSEEFKFSTVPGVQAAAATIDGYGAVLGNMLQTREGLLFDYGMTAKNIFQGAVGTAMMARPVIRALMQLPAQIRMLRQARNIVAGVRAIRTASVLASPAAGPAAWASAVASSVLLYFGGEAAAELAQAALADHATRQAIKAHTPELLVPERITGDFENYRSTFMRHDIDNAYPTMERMLTDRFMGVSADMFAYDYNRASGITKKMSMSGVMPENQQGEYAMRAMQLDGMFGSGTMFEGTMADMSRITMGGDVDEATELFQEFFSSLVVDGRLHVSQLALVGELSSFSESYVMGRMFNLEDGASNLARTHQFLNPIFGNRQSTAATQQMVTGVDSVIQQGAFGENIHVSNIMARTGITRGEAAHGITSNPETLEKFLYGMYLQMGIGQESFDENGDLNDSDMQRFMSYTQHGLNMDSSTSKGMYAAYREFVKGARGEEVSTAYADNVMTEAGEGSDEMGLIKLTQGWVKGSRVLSEITFSYADVLMDMHTSISNLSAAVMPAAMTDIVTNLQRAESVMGREDLSAVDIIRRAFRSLFSLPENSAVSGGRAATTGGVAVGAAAAAIGEEDLTRFARLYNSLIQQESGGVHTTASGALLESGAGARGISQVMRATGENPGYGVAPLKDQSVEEYLRFGEDYLSAMLREYGNDEKKALAAYNWGPGNVNWAIANYGLNWLDYAPQETKDYVRRVLGRLQSTGGSMGGFTSGSSSSSSRVSSQIVTEYVNIDIELVGQNTSDFARHFENSFMRA